MTTGRAWTCVIAILVACGGDDSASGTSSGADDSTSTSTSTSSTTTSTTTTASTTSSTTDATDSSGPATSDSGTEGGTGSTSDATSDGTTSGATTEGTSIGDGSTTEPDDTTGDADTSTGGGNVCPGANVMLIEAAFVPCNDGTTLGQTAEAAGVTCEDVCCVMLDAPCSFRAAQAGFDACMPAPPMQSGDCSDVFQQAWSSQCVCAP